MGARGLDSGRLAKTIKDSERISDENFKVYGYTLKGGNYAIYIISSILTKVNSYWKEFAPQETILSLKSRHCFERASHLRKQTGSCTSCCPW